MTNGYTACLKTTVARRIADELEVPLIEAYRLGKVVTSSGVVSNEKRDARYKIIAEITKIYLQNGIPVVIDATFNFRRWREYIYEITKQYPVSDTVIVKCFCHDVALIQKRLTARQANSLFPDQEVTNIANYFKTVQENEIVEADILPDGRMPAIVEFDSGAFVAKVMCAQTNLAKQVVEIIQHIKNEV